MAVDEFLHPLRVQPHDGLESDFVDGGIFDDAHRRNVAHMEERANISVPLGNPSACVLLRGTKLLRGSTMPGGRPTVFSSRFEMFRGWVGPRLETVEAATPTHGGCVFIEQGVVFIRTFLLLRREFLVFMDATPGRRRAARCHGEDERAEGEHDGGGAVPHGLQDDGPGRGSPCKHCADSVLFCNRNGFSHLSLWR